jgi:tetratricopeptide (TPR) repeat protein
MTLAMEQVARRGSVPPVPIGESLRQAEKCRAEGRLAEAEALCRRALEARADLPEAEHLLGVIMHQSGKLGEAIEHVGRAVKLAPQVALYHANLGEMLRLSGRPKLAAEEARRALEIEPNLAMALTNLGVALYEMEDFEESIRAHRKAIAAQPEFTDAHSNLGNALHALRRFDEAIVAYRRAIELNPEFADAWANLGNTLQHAGDYEEAVVALRRAIELAPEHANARSGISILLLMRGDFGEGWYEYEWRLRSTEQKGPRFPEKPWQGESLKGKHIYVQAEQGLGDSVQFARYIPLLIARGAKVTARVQDPFVPLLRESFPDITVMGARGAPPAYDCDAALLSLPYLLKTRLETIPADIPYLRVPEQTVLRWKSRLATSEGVKLGVAWAGNPKHPNDARRSVDLSVLTPLFDVRGTHFTSLQVGPRAADLSKLKNNAQAIEDFSKDLSDFAETAGAITALDLVFTVDTAVAHIAGALGKPVWVLIPWTADWRWMLGREDNPWYPTMRLFRQKRGEDWADVIARVVEQLKAVAGGDAAPLMPFKAEGERRAAQAAAIIAVATARANRPATIQAQTTRHAPSHPLVLAEQKRREGFLADAEELSRRAIAAEPANAEAVHMLGIVAHQSGKLNEAIEHVRRAIAIKPDVALYHANLGEMCRLAGRIDEAIAAGRRALELNPDYPTALSNLGIALFDQDKFEEALGYHDRAIALQKDFAQAHSNRGNTLQRLKRFAEAEQAYRRALELQPNFADAWNNLGTCLREMKRPEEAETIYRKSLELGPNNPYTLDNLALTMRDLERLEPAADLLRRALAIEPRSDKLHIHYGSVLLDQDKLDEAALEAERAIAIDANNHDTMNLMGRVTFKRGDLQSAVDYYRRALALKPDFADAHNNMGNALRELGKLQQAQESYIDALKLDPNNVGVYFNLSDIKKFTPGDPQLAAMEALAANPDGLLKNDRIQLDFAIGKAYADLQDYSRSFAHFLAGNAAKRATISYDEKTILASFDSIEAVFTPELIAAKSGGGDPSPMPIFVIGMPRSGTTLIEQIIASHPMVHGAGELQNLNDVIRTVRGSDGNTIPYPEFVPAVEAAALAQIGARYVASLQALVPKEARNCERVTDKMPSNYYFAGLIHLALPNATIIHTVRDPVDTCVSCFSKLFAAEQNHTYNLGEIGRYHKRYQHLMDHWHRVLPAGRILDIRYEDVVADVEKEARRIIAHCGLPWNDRCLSFYETDRPVRTASASQVRQPIFTSAVGRWQRYGNRRLGPLLAALGVATPK